jgi:hypothetical protein
MKTRVAALVLVAACSDGNNKPKDAAVDAAPDAGTCPTNRFFTGELVDWDSGTAMEGFCGIFMAQFTVHDSPTITSSTNPNGRFEVCVPSATATRVDLTPPTGQSECTNPLSSYSMPGITMADPGVIASGMLISMRNFTVARAPSVLTPNPADAHVFVHVDGPQAAVSLSGTSGAPQAFDGTTWAPGATGVNVFFPNVQITGSVSVSMTGATAGAGPVLLEAGHITYVTLVAM